MKKVIDIEERIPAMRKKRRRRANQKFVLVIVIFLIALLSILYFQSSKSRIDKIKVNGASIHDAAYYIEKSGIQEGSGLWGFTKGKVNERLAKVEGVKSVEVSRKWLRDVELTVTEWRPIAYLENEGQYGLLLENGDVFMPKQLSPEEDAPILIGFSEEKIQNSLTKQLKAMENNVYQLISEIIYSGTAEEPNRITVFMDDGYEVKVLLPTFAEKMIYYPDITAQLTGKEKGVIDMEVGTYFTPYSQFYGVTDEINIGEVKEEEEVDEADE